MISMSEPKNSYVDRLVKALKISYVGIWGTAVVGTACYMAVNGISIPEIVTHGVYASFVIAGGEAVLKAWKNPKEAE